MPDSVKYRKELKAKGQLGCPESLNYPLDTKQHVQSAINYYGHPNTVKCKGFWKRTCTAAKRVGLDTPKVQEKCHI